MPVVTQVITSKAVQMINSRNLTGGEHVVRATKWVIVNKVCVTGTRGTCCARGGAAMARLNDERTVDCPDGVPRQFQLLFPGACYQSVYDSGTNYCRKCDRIFKK